MIHLSCLHGNQFRGWLVHCSRYDLLTFVRQQGISILSAIVAIASYRGKKILGLTMWERIFTHILGKWDISKETILFRNLRIELGFSFEHCWELRNSSSIPVFLSGRIHPVVPPLNFLYVFCCIFFHVNILCKFYSSMDAVIMKHANVWLKQLSYANDNALCRVGSRLSWGW